MKPKLAILNPIPRHVGIIMDGNGRWAENQTKERLYGHQKGVETVSDIIKAALELKIDFLTLYTFSTENWLRPKQEVSGLFQLIESFISDKEQEFLRENIRFTCIGDLSALPAKTQKMLQSLIEKSANGERLTICAALNYGGRAEIITAVKQFAQNALQNPALISKLNEQEFASLLYTNDMPEPELIIRTGGEKRISNFLLWQSAYSEWYFTDILWPNFSKQDFFTAVDFYRTRKRRFGMAVAMPSNEKNSDQNSEQNKEIAQ